MKKKIISYVDILHYLKALSDSELQALRNEVEKELGLRERQRREDEKRLSEMDLLNVHLSAKVYNVLRSGHIKYLSELQEWTKDDFLALRNAGPATLRALEKVMQHYNISFKKT